MDTSIGQVVQHLKDNGQYNNTIIIFSSDVRLFALDTLVLECMLRGPPRHFATKKKVMRQFPNYLCVRQ